MTDYSNTDSMIPQQLTTNWDSYQVCNGYIVWIQWRKGRFTSCVDEADGGRFHHANQNRTKFINSLFLFDMPDSYWPWATEAAWNVKPCVRASAVLWQQLNWRLQCESQVTCWIAELGRVSPAHFRLFKQGNRTEYKDW